MNQDIDGPHFEYESKRTLDPELYSNFLEKCAEWEVQRFDVLQEQRSLEDWGKEFKYLTQKGDESQYLKDLATGPFYLNMINLLMVFPFLVSTIVESLTSFRKKEEKPNASKFGLGFMIAGFVMLIIGLIIIATAFYLASKPFLF